MNPRTVAVYARVSTEHEAQISALENQVQYYGNILEYHPEWKLYKYYIDEGITGTSINKRQNFLRMMQDASEGKFDLIITREVSRFARNTVDTLQQTRILKKQGVEVYFTEDNIWTMNDEDGELRLTIMATLAQNESKKTSIRVKAGQMISFQNAIPYGTGNILGYDRVGRQLVVNHEQAETVQEIYKLYLAGNGQRKIQFELEKQGRKTPTGKTNWHPSYISRILRNPFYCGTIVYRKEYVPDYLEQKKVRNYDEVDKIVVEGKHEPIISKEDFAKVQEILDSKHASVSNREKRPRGLHSSNDVWCKKLKCECGGSFQRRVWHKVDGVPQYAYQCYKQAKTGTIKTRTNKGLSLEGVCKSPMVQQWKLGVTADVIFQQFWMHREEVLSIANEMLEKHIADDRESDFSKEIEKLEKQIDKIDLKLKNLLDLRLSDDISKEDYLDKKHELESRLLDLQEKLSNYKIEEEVSDEDLESKLKVLKYGLEQDFNFETHCIPDTIIDAFVKQIIVYEDFFVWKLRFSDASIKCIVTGKTNSPKEIILSEFPTNVDGDTGCNCPEVSN